MKKFMALTLVAMLILCSMVVFADDAVVTEETVEETVEAISEEAEVEAISEEAEEVVEEEATEEVTEEATEEVVEEVTEEIAVSTITLQINNKTMFVNDDQIELDVPAQLINERTMVPMRAIFEALDAEVSWDDATWTAKGEKNGIVVEIAIDSNTMYVNGEAVEIDVPAQLVEERTLVPVRAISEAFGSAVTWDESSETVIILTPVAEEEVTEETVEEVVEEEATEEVVEEEATEEVVEEATEEVVEDEEAAEEVTEDAVEDEEAPAEEVTEEAADEEVVEEPEEATTEEADAE